MLDLLLHFLSDALSSRSKKTPDINPEPGPGPTPAQRWAQRQHKARVNYATKEQSVRSAAAVQAYRRRRGAAREAERRMRAGNPMKPRSTENDYEIDD